MNLREVYEKLTDYEKLCLLAAFGLPAKHICVSKNNITRCEKLTLQDLPNAGLSTILGLLEKKLLRNLDLPADPFKFSIGNPNAGNNFATTAEGNLMVLAIVQAEYGYDNQPYWLD
jgi:hypothetical protein